jgi:4-diphosphocytidyl-2-C-methyl-D-erythritol kinase
VVLFPNCKINLGLNAIRKREDGFHDIETIFYPLSLQDVLEIIPSNQTHSNTPVTFHSSGLTIGGEIADNICVKAYYLLKREFPALPPVQMHLHKVIPMGAGLGGGSADGAYVLKLLNILFTLRLSQQQLIDYALQLGSDCPFFIYNQPCFAVSRGEKMQKMELDLSSFTILLINPSIHVSTGWAFNQLISHQPLKSVKQIIQQPITTWQDELINDFEAPVMECFREIKLLKEQLYQQGAIYASMSGSGSTVFGIFEKNTVPLLHFPANYFVQIL